MRFYVLDAAGNVLGREEIPFRRAARGFAYEFDAI